MRKLSILALLLVLSNCVNIADHYGITLCGNKACAYKDYEGKASARLDNQYTENIYEAVSEAIVKAADSCLVGYAIIYKSFPSEDEIWDFQWKHEINADFIMYRRFESNEAFYIEKAPFKLKYWGVDGSSHKLSLIYFYVDKKRAISCYDPLNLTK